MANLSISELAKKTKMDLDATVRQFINNLAESCIYKSPVGMPEIWNPPVWPKGYIPGHFVNNWQHGLNSMPTNEIAGEDKSGDSSRNRIKESVASNNVSGTHYIVNNSPYARKLEYGNHSWQVLANGMVGLTVLEADMHLRRAIASVK